ncbi:MAG: alpha/beta fold hydrolase [Clostridia bacterium]|nr:alpha/beta fold hydrolase [Clostridia bacterium]
MSIKRKEAYFTSDYENNKARVLLWQDEKAAPVGIVQIVHNFGEHIGRYDEFARFLVGNGFAVCGADLPGHGKSVRALSDLGQVLPGAHASMLRDMHTLMRLMKKRCGELPYFVVGQGAGAALAQLFAANFADDLAGAVLCGLFSLPGAAVAFGDGIGNVLDVVPGNTAFPAIAAKLLGTLSGRLLDDDEQLPWLSADMPNRADYLTDPLCGFRLTRELLAEAFTAAEKANYASTLAKYPARFPLLLLGGGKDPLSGFGRGVVAVSDRMVLAGLDPEVILYPGDRNDILHEADKEKVFSEILAFFREAADA